jgi:hypothetical protein
MEKERVRGPGRPTIPKSERQDTAVLIRMRPNEVRDLRKLADRAGVGIGVYAREVLRRHLRRSRT